MTGQAQGARIAFVLPSFAGGGAERAILTLAGALPAERASAHIVVVDGRGPLAGVVPPGVGVTNLAARRVRDALSRLVRELKRLAPDIVVPTMGYLNVAVLASRSWLPRGMRIVAREANMPEPALATTRRPWLWRQAYRRLYPRADLILCNARAVADGLAAFAKLDPARILIVPNPVDAGAVRRMAAIPSREPGPGRRFVAAGRLVAQKNLAALIEAAVRLDEEDRVTILGEGPLRGALERDARARGVDGRVRFRGFVVEPWPAYAGADAFLLPSLWEGLPNAALEALACGTPVIAAPTAGGVVDMAAETAGVTIAAVGQDFVAAMRAVTPRSDQGSRPSLLPERFEAAAAAADFLDALGL